MGQLSGSDIASLSKKLVGTLSAPDLESLVYASTGDRLYDEFVPDNLPLRPTIERLLNALENAGTTYLFLAAVYRLRSKHRPDIAAEIARICPEAIEKPAETGAEIQVQVAGKLQAEGPAKPSAPGFQRNIRPNLPQLDAHVWISRFQDIERQVCRVERNGNAAGTGFLVGPDAVLTNWHVVEGAIQAGALSAVTCRFDYLRLVDGTRQPGVSVGLHQAGCLSFGSYAPAELTKTPDNPEPNSGELDYALLRLASAVGNKNDGEERGWIRLPDSEMPMKKGDPLIIVQHPDGSPMKLALDTNAILGVNANRTRVRYTTNTEAGSSGSPVFTLDWALVALHHFGDPAWVGPVYNQGVPAQLIRQKITQDGFGASLGD